jgi:glycosyltransferase involved in cell wall biosynthesis
MRLLIVVQRYGAEVFGGAEQLARMVAEQFHGRGDEVEVLASRAVSYTDWANWYPEGESVVNGVRVHRLSVARPRSDALFSGINARAAAYGWQLAPHVEREWMRLQGPEVPQIKEWLGDQSGEFDFTLFFTYLYYTTWAGLRATRSTAVLQPTAHDEPPAYLTLFDEMFRLPDGFAFITPEEAAFVVNRYGVRRPNRVVGIGFEPSSGDAARFRARFGLGQEPYLLCVGRTEPGKGSVQLFEFFRTYKSRRPGSMKLVFLGEEVYPLPRDDAVIMTGFVDASVRNDALAGALALVQPSFFESFSMVLAEAWAAGLPAIVQARCAVLAGQAARSHAGLPYATYGEFEAAVDLLQENEELRRAMGRQGQEYVQRNFRWDRVLRVYDSLFEEILTHRVRPATYLAS